MNSSGSLGDEQRCERLSHARRSRTSVKSHSLSSAPVGAGGRLPILSDRQAGAQDVHM